MWLKNQPLGTKYKIKLGGLVSSGILGHRKPLGLASCSPGVLLVFFHENSASGMSLKPQHPSKLGACVCLFVFFRFVLTGVVFAPFSEAERDVRPGSRL